MTKILIAAVVFAAVFSVNRVARTQDVSSPAAPAPNDEAVATELQGRWKLKSAQVALDDELGQSAQEKLEELVLTVDGREMLYENSGGGTRKGRIVDVSRGDGVTTIDFTTGDVKRFGIFKVNDRKLQICFSSITPPKAEFRPKSLRLENPRSGHMLLTFSREEAEQSDPRERPASRELN